MITPQQQNNPIARERSTIFTMQSSDCSDNDDDLVKDLSISQKQVGEREQHHNVRGGKRNTGGVPTTKSKAARTLARKPSPRNNMEDDEEEEEEEEDEEEEEELTLTSKEESYWRSL
jgi:hypothetical protein